MTEEISSHGNGETNVATAFRKAGYRGTRARRRTFALIRRHDVSGVSGCGLIAEGAVFEDGAAVLRWRGPRPTTTVFDSLDDLISIHGHGGSTRLIFDWEDMDG